MNHGQTSVIIIAIGQAVSPRGRRPVSAGNAEKREEADDGECARKEQELQGCMLRSSCRTANRKA
jgi:hypothetical protein